MNSLKLVTASRKKIWNLENPPKKIFWFLDSGWKNKILEKRVWPGGTFLAYRFTPHPHPLQNTARRHNRLTPPTASHQTLLGAGLRSPPTTATSRRPTQKITAPHNSPSVRSTIILWKINSLPNQKIIIAIFCGTCRILNMDEAIKSPIFKLYKDIHYDYIFYR